MQQTLFDQMPLPINWQKDKLGWYYPVPEPGFNGIGGADCPDCMRRSCDREHRMLQYSPTPDGKIRLTMIGGGFVSREYPDLPEATEAAARWQHMPYAEIKAT